MWIARISRTLPPSITTTEVLYSPMCTSTWAVSTGHRPPCSAALTMALVSSSISSGSTPAFSHSASGRRRSLFCTAVIRNSLESCASSTMWKSTTTSSMLQCGSRLSTSNLSTSSTLAFSEKGSLSVRKAPRPASIAIATLSCGTLASLAAWRSVAAASCRSAASSPLARGSSPSTCATILCFFGLPSRTTSSKRRGPTRMPQDRAMRVQWVVVGRPSASCSKRSRWSSGRTRSLIRPR